MSSSKIAKSQCPQIQGLSRELESERARLRDKITVGMRRGQVQNTDAAEQLRFIKRRLKQLKRECTRLEIHVLQAENVIDPDDFRRGRDQEGAQDRLLEFEKMIMQSMLVNKKLLNKLGDMRSARDDDQNPMTFDQRRQNSAQRRSKTVASVAASSSRRRQRKANLSPGKAANWTYSQRVARDDRSQMRKPRILTEESLTDLPTRTPAVSSVSSRQRKVRRKPKKVRSWAANESSSIYSRSRAVQDENRDRDQMRKPRILTEESLADLPTRTSAVSSVSSRQRKVQRKPKKVSTERGHLSVGGGLLSKCSSERI